MTELTPPRPVVLCILDGWGHSDVRDNNAVRLGRTPNIDAIAAAGPTALLDASEGEVGLPAGQMGNSEVGHMNIGAGRVVMQDLPRIDADIASGDFRDNPGLTGFIGKLKANGGSAHLLGLLSPGGVHSHQDQMAALAQAIDAAGVPVVVHAFLDGRDTPPQSALAYIKNFRTAAPKATFATVSGRYYAMDRDTRWERVSRAYDAIVTAQGAQATTPAGAVEQSYAAGVDDEFVLPTVIDGYHGIAGGDGLLMANFRADRAREILHALLDPAFDGFERRDQPDFAVAVGMVEYSTALNAFLDTLYPPIDLADTLGEVVATAGLKQLRIAETEKYAHVTFFLNGGREEPFDGEERIMVPSPKVATYDLQPQMSALEVTDKLVDAIAGGAFDLVVCNYANGDMVGHTGNLEAAIVAVETIDDCVGRVAEAVRAAGGCMIVTADHGNAEQMRDAARDQAHTAHTLNKVPLLLVNGPSNTDALSNGRLSDIAPMILDLMGLPKPAVMTGQTLIRRAADEAAAE